MSGRQLKRARGYKSASSGRAAGRPRYSRGKAGPSNLGSGAVGGRRRQNVRTAGFLGVEHKFYDTSLVNCSVSAAANATGGECDPSVTSMISTPPQGDNASSRDGKRILIESVQIQGVVYIVAKNGNGVMQDYPMVFIALVEDHQTNAAILDSEAVFKNPGGVTGLAASPLKNLLSGNRFTTHKVWQLKLPLPPTVAEGVNDIGIMGQTIPFSMFKKLAMTVDFNGGTTADIGNVVNNSLHMIAYVNDGNWATKLSYNARIRFVG